MAIKVVLTRNLRRNILQGHPWVYRMAVDLPKGERRAQFCKIIDQKGAPLGCGFFDPHSPLAVRVLHPEKSNFTENDMLERFTQALNLRKPLLGSGTDSYRLFNGEGDYLPGLVCDLYNRVAVLQFDGQGPSEFWPRELVCTWLKEKVGCEQVFEKTRGEECLQLVGPASEGIVECSENSVRFMVNIKKGQKTGFFLDQRDNRQYVRTISSAKNCLNLFSYTGGFSVSAGLGGATPVASVDIAAGAIEQADANWRLNGLPDGTHQSIATDVFDFLQVEKASWDLIIVDPPSMAHSEEQRGKAREKYSEIFALAAKRVSEYGSLCLSSCSSHISFEDFFTIIETALSQARRRGQIQRVSGQGMDHPFPHACPELRYLKFAHLVLY